jgi:phosphoribosylanthranilate isomerase
VIEFTRGHVKICGVTTLGDANAVIDAGATSIGFNLAPSSPRRLSLERALALSAATKGRIVRCAIFGESDDDFILNALDVIDIDVVQLHGPLDETLLTALRERRVSIVKALSIESDEFYDFDDSAVDAVLIDGAQPGSGVAHSWQELASRSFSVPVIAAGGLNVDNVAATIALTGAWGVDAASGVEQSPGVKDRELVKSFVENARRAFGEETT